MDAVKRILGSEIAATNVVTWEDTAGVAASPVLKGTGAGTVPEMGDGKKCQPL